MSPFFVLITVAVSAVLGVPLAHLGLGAALGLALYWFAVDLGAVHRRKP